MFNRYTRTSPARTLFGGTSAALLTAISAVGLSLATTNVHAEETSRQTAVSYHDLDLAKSSDANELYRRLQRAARSVCRDPNTREVRRLLEYRACYQDALRSAVTDVDHYALTALHRASGQDRVAQRSGTSTPEG